jgi:hypothetical protein
MFKNGANTALRFSTYGGSNSGVNSSTSILLDSGSDPTPGANFGNIKFNIATNAEGGIDRFVITPTTSIFYNNVGIGKTPGQPLDVSGNLLVSANIYNKSIISSYAGAAGNVNVLARTTGTINLISEQGNIYLNTNSINRFQVNPDGLIHALILLIYQEIQKHLAIQIYQVMLLVQGQLQPQAVDSVH